MRQAPSKAFYGLSHLIAQQLYGAIPHRDPILQRKRRLREIKSPAKVTQLVMTEAEFQHKESLSLWLLYQANFHIYRRHWGIGMPLGNDGHSWGIRDIIYIFILSFSCSRVV